MRVICCVVGLVFVLGAIAGCANLGETKISSPYITQVERQDQKVDGNRGYIQGTPPPAEDLTGRKRPLITVDVDLPRTSSEAGIPDTKFTNTRKSESTENVK